MALIEGCRHELEFTVPLEDIQAETERVLLKIQKKANLPGFRPGKAPLSIIKNRFHPDIRQEVMEALIPKALGKRFKEERLDVVGQPSIVDLKFDEGQPMVFKAQFDVHPEFVLGEYKGLEVEYEDPIVPEEDIAKRLEDLRESKAEYINIDPRPIVDGDYAVVGLESIEGIEGEPIKNPEMTLKVGDPDTIPAFTEALLGMSPGDTKYVDISYPEDYGQERLAGKTVKFDVELKFVRSKELPDLDDEFAQGMGDFRTLDELREQVKNSIFGERQYESQDTAKSALLEKLADIHDFPVPEEYIERQTESQLQNYARSLASQGIDPRTLKIDWAKLKETQRPRAIRDVRTTLVLDRIATVESINAEQSEVDREVQRMARQQREPLASVRLKLEKDGGLDRIANGIRTNKTINHIFEHARKLVPTPKPAAVEGEALNPEVITPGE
jgi:trigger factor